MKTKLMPLIGAAVTIALGATAALADNGRHGHRLPQLAPAQPAALLGTCEVLGGSLAACSIASARSMARPTRSMVATARGAGNAGGVNAELPAAWAANRTRPLCPYPSVALYKGSGDVESASSFECRATRRHHQHHDDEDD
jgi:hypothetical protein